MSDLKKYVSKRMKKEKAFALKFREVYEDFKMGVMPRHPGSQTNEKKEHRKE